MANLIRIIENRGERSGGTNDQGVRTAHRQFNLQFDSPVVGKIEVLAATGLPQLFWPYELPGGEQDLGLLVRDRNAKQTEDCYWWNVDIEYSSQTADPNQTQNENPLLRPPDISWSSESVEVALVRDYDSATDTPNAGAPILNSADETFDPPPATTEELLVLNYSRNVVAIDPVLRRSQKNKTNNAAWYGFDTGTAKLADWNASKAFENNLNFFKETFVIKIAQSAEFWFYRPLDQGFFFINGNGDRELITDTAGRALQAPALLDGAGGKLAVGGDPVFLSFVILGEFNFDNLGIV